MLVALFHFLSYVLLSHSLAIDAPSSLSPTTLVNVTATSRPRETNCSADKEAIEGRCCSRCPPGQGMVKRCVVDKDFNLKEDTVCQPCSVTAKTFSSAYSARANCEKCNPCTGLETVERECTLKSDTVCKCIAGYFRSSGTCRPCSKCQEGYGKVGNCSGTQDAVCKPCQDGYFSVFVNFINNRECLACTKCPAPYVMEKACTRLQDTVCRNPATGKLLPKKHRIPPPGPEMDPSGKVYRQPDNWLDLIDNGNRGRPKPLPPQQANGTNHGKDSPKPYAVDNNMMIPIYCAILGMVIFGLVFWVVFKYIQRRRQGIKWQQANSSLLPPSNPSHSPQAPAQQGLLRGLPHKPNSIDSGFCGSEIPVTIAGSRKFKDISSSRFQRLENVLCNDPDPQGWRKLAVELGFDEEAMTRFESESDTVRQTPVRLLLKEWSESDQHTVSFLGKALHKIGRKDAVFLLKEAERHHHHKPHHRQLKEEGLTEMCQV